MATMGAWKPQSHHRRVVITWSPWEGGNHRRVVTTHGNHTRVETMKSPWEGGNHGRVETTESPQEDGW